MLRFWLSAFTLVYLVQISPVLAQISRPTQAPANQNPAANIDTTTTAVNLPLYGCRFNVPDFWLVNKLDKDSPAAYVIDNPLGGKFVLTVKDIKQSVDVTSSEYGDVVKNQLRQQGFTINRGVVSQFRGHPAYVVDCVGTLIGHPMYMKSVSFMDGTVLYSLTLGRLDKKPDTDPLYLGILESFQLSN